MFDYPIEINLPKPAIRRPVELWTGKQVFSVLVCPNESGKYTVLKNDFFGKEKDRYIYLFLFIYVLLYNLIFFFVIEKK
jgi:hypothetical protein